jgi:catechol 2,3-dioxygenase-like lactoylglutathione lyase family enzyme
MIRGVHHVGVHTPNLDRLKALYEKAFGFEMVGDEMNLGDLPQGALITGVPGAAARVVMLRAKNMCIELFQWSTPEGERLRPLRAHDFGYTHFAVDVSNIDEEYRRLSDLGMTFVQPAPVWVGDVASVYGHDPDGNLIEVLEIPGGNVLHLQV